MMSERGWKLFGIVGNCVFHLPFWSALVWTADSPNVTSTQQTELTLLETTYYDPPRIRFQRPYLLHIDPWISKRR